MEDKAEAQFGVEVYGSIRLIQFGSTDEVKPTFK